MGSLACQSWGCTWSGWRRFLSGLHFFSGFFRFLIRLLFTSTFCSGFCRGQTVLAVFNFNCLCHSVLIPLLPSCVVCTHRHQVDQDTAACLQVGCPQWPLSPSGSTCYCYSADLETKCLGKRFHHHMAIYSGSTAITTCHLSKTGRSYHIGSRASELHLETIFHW